MNGDGGLFWDGFWDGFDDGFDLGYGHVFAFCQEAVKCVNVGWCGLFVWEWSGDAAAAVVFLE